MVRWGKQDAGRNRQCLLSSVHTGVYIAGWRHTLIMISLCQGVSVIMHYLFNCTCKTLCAHSCKRMRAREMTDVAGLDVFIVNI